MRTNSGFFLIGACMLAACAQQRPVQHAPPAPGAESPALPGPPPRRATPPEPLPEHQYTAELRVGAINRLRVERRDPASDACVTMVTMDPGLPYRQLSIDADEPSGTRVWMHRCDAPAAGPAAFATAARGWLAWNSDEANGCRIDIELELTFSTEAGERRDVLHARDLEVRGCR